MKITELLKRDTVIMDLTASNKEAVIDELVEKLNGANRLNSKTEFKEAIFKAGGPKYDWNRGRYCNTSCEDKGC